MKKINSIDTPIYVFYPRHKNGELKFIPKVEKTFRFINPKNYKRDLLEKGIKETSVPPRYFLRAKNYYYSKL